MEDLIFAATQQLIAQRTLDGKLKNIFQFNRNPIKYCIGMSTSEPAQQNLRQGHLDTAMERGLNGLMQSVPTTFRNEECLSTSDPNTIQRVAQPIDEKSGLFLPHSQQSLFGVDNADQFCEHYVQSNFHARILNQINPELRHFPDLDSYLAFFIDRRICMGEQLEQLDHQILSTHAQLEKLKVQRAKTPQNTDDAETFAE